MSYVYRMSSTGESSAKYGPCEVCHANVSEVWIQSEQRERSDGIGLTFYGCSPVGFGHKACLESIRHTEANSEGVTG